MSYSPARPVTVIARDPSVTAGGRIVRAVVEVPNEELLPGPCGYRVRVIDYDASTGILYRPAASCSDGDSFAGSSDDELLENPGFHALNSYAIAMRTLARFEFALGRRVAWSFPAHQIKIAPHAFAGANAFYSPADEALLFGYLRRARGGRARGGRPAFTCLSHDIVAHETTHALVDGLRPRYTDASSPEQAGFHEGFADLVALLSVFALREIVARILDPGTSGGTIPAEAVTPDALRRSMLLCLGNELGEELSGVRGIHQALGDTEAW